LKRRPSLDPDLEEMRRLGHAAIDRIVEHLASLGEQRVARRGTASEFAALVDEPLPEEGFGEEDSLRFFFERVVPSMTRVNHPRFHAYIPCPSSFAGALGEILAAGTNPFVGSWLGGATVSSLELTVLRWIAETVGYPSDGAGILTSGGSIANLVALAAARAKFGRETLDSGRIYVSEEGHASMNRAATLLGYAPDAVRRVPVDDRLRMKPDHLRRWIHEDRAAGLRPFFVCVNAGTTNTGAIDPLEETADLCAELELWLHVDAAYGGFAALTEEGRALLAGMDRAHSLTVDPHKWLYVPMGVGCVLLRDAEALETAFSEHSDYLQDLPPDEVNFLDRGPELSRPGRVLSVWMLLRSLGRRELARHVEKDFRLARLAADLIRADDRFELVDEPQMTVVAFRHRAQAGETEEHRAARDLELMEKTLADGGLMMSTTLTGGRTALRFVVMNHRTTEDDVRRSVASIRELS
jgi:glutamate/tyrosine decarboxylase-like PLP-dependent enzyme